MPRSRNVCVNGERQNLQDETFVLSSCLVDPVPEGTGDGSFSIFIAYSVVMLKQGVVHLSFLHPPKDAHHPPLLIMMPVVEQV